MILNYLTQCWKKRFFRSMICIMILSFTITTCGCYTTHKDMIPPESLGKGVTYHILKAVMNDGRVIDFKGNQVAFVKKYQNYTNVILYESAETTWVSAGVYNVSSTNLKVIEIKDVQSLLVEKEEINSGMTVLATVGIVAGLALIIGLVAIASDNNGSSYTPAPYNGEGGEKGSCPLFYSLDNGKYILDCEPYGGSISEVMKRTDYSKLEHLKVSDGKFKLLMRNEADETQHTDALKLIVAEHPVNTDAAVDNNGQISVFEKAIAPVSVTDENGNDITVFFNKKDNIDWQTSMPFDTVYAYKQLKHDLTFRFPKPRDTKNAKLLFKVGTAQWAEFMFRGMLDLKGNGVDRWYGNMNNKGEELFKLNRFLEREELYVMKVNVLENDNWITKGSIISGNPAVEKEMFADLNIENVSGDTLYIKLSPPSGFWKIDYTGIIYESTGPSMITELSLSYAKDENGIDLKESLSGIDGRYYSMPDLTNYAMIEFDVPALQDNMKQSLFLKTTGYYDIHLKKDKPEQADMVEKMYNTPGLILEMSMNEYIKKIKSIGISDK